MIEYNESKLSGDRELMSKLAVFDAGLGAVGSHLMEHQVKKGVGRIVGCDRDRMEPDNYAKCSGLLRHPQDDGRFKAEACAERMMSIARPGTVIGSLNADVTRLGPRAFARFDYVINSLDNMTAKEHMNRMIRLCRPDERPVLLSCGTIGEASEANIYVPGGACLRCGTTDKWLEQPDRSWSCTGGADYLVRMKQENGLATDDTPSDQSALDALRLMAAHAKSLLPPGQSMRLAYTPFPYLNLSKTRLDKREDCPDCALEPPERWTELDGCTYTLTLGDAFAQISAKLGHDDYYIRPYALVLPDQEGDRRYDQYVAVDRCRCCGRRIPVYQHTGRIRDDQIVCGRCHAKGLDAVPVERRFEDAEVYRAFRPGKCGADLLHRTLYEMGFAIGAYIEVELDAHRLPADAEQDTVVFVCADDPDFIYNCDSLSLA